MKVKHFMFRAALFCSCLALFSGTLSANSLFSQLGIGTLRYYPGAKYLAMGQTGIAAPSVLSLQYANPAAISFLASTRFEGSFLYESASVDFGGLSGKFADSGFNAIHVGIPMFRGYSFSFGLAPMSAVGYQLRADSEEFEPEQTLTGSGGLQRGFLQFAGRIKGRFAYGAGMDIYFGRLEREWRVNFNSLAYANTLNEQSVYARGIGFQGGVMWNIVNQFSIAATYHIPVTLDTESELNYNITTEEPERVDGELELPAKLGFGLRYQPNGKLLFLADLQTQAWDEISSDRLLGATAVSSTRYGFGTEITPSRTAEDGFFARLSYRLGFAAGKLPYLDENGAEVDETFFTLGVGVPYNRYRSNIDIAFEFGKRSSAMSTGADENVARLTLSVASGERWFVRPKRR